jgi:hypothetical protein
VLGLLTVASVALSSVHVLFAFGFSDVTIYGDKEATGMIQWVPFILHAASGLLLVPLGFAGSLYTVECGVSQVRFRQCGWISAMLASLLVLLAPLDPALGILASPGFAMVMYLLPVATLLPRLQSAALEEATKALEPAPSARPSTPIKRNRSKSPALLSMAKRRAKTDESIAAPKGAGRVPLSTAVVFVLAGCVVGTHAEALNDMAIGLKVRGSLSRGTTTLAVAEKLR